MIAQALRSLSSSVTSLFCFLICFFLTIGYVNRLNYRSITKNWDCLSECKAKSCKKNVLFFSICFSSQSHEFITRYWCILERHIYVSKILKRTVNGIKNVSHRRWTKFHLLLSLFSVFCVCTLGGKWTQQMFDTFIKVPNVFLCRLHSSLILNAFRVIQRICLYKMRDTADFDRRKCCFSLAFVQMEFSEWMWMR